MDQNNRSGDPKAWECLDDEQRNIISDWYHSICQRQQERENEIQKSCESAALDPSICMIVWFAFLYSLHGKGTILELILAFVVYTIFFYGGTFLIYHAGLRTENAIFRRIFWAVATAFAFALICGR